MRHTKGTTAAACSLLMLFASQLNAGALYIPETGSPQETGFAGAGMTARAQDAGTVFTNPAGMTRLDDNATLASAGLLYLHGPFETDTANTISGADGDTSLFLPYGAFAYSHSISDELKLGISVQNNFGLSLDWSDNWVGRYTATKATIMAPQIQPTIAYKVNNELSIGVGAALTMGYLDAELKVNQPISGDGHMHYKDTDFAVQANIGIMYEPSTDTRFGMRYLSEASLDFSDDPDFRGLGPALSAVTSLINNIDLGMKMPQAVTLGMFHHLDNKWSVLGSVGWEQFSHFGYITASVNTSGSVVTNADFDDVWHAGVGAQYKYSPEWTINSGFSYDSSLSTDGSRSIALPMGNMYRFGIGGEYKKREDLAVGIAADIMWEGDVPVTRDSGPGVVSGHYDEVFILFTTIYAKWQ